LLMADSPRSPFGKARRARRRCSARRQRLME
jgi:hypothetical protein